MDKNQQPKGYIQKLEEFGSAVREQGYNSTIIYCALILHNSDTASSS